jgi:hypothetical protein
MANEFYKQFPKYKTFFREGTKEEIAALSPADKLRYLQEIEDPKLEDRRLEFQNKVQALLEEYQDALAPRLRDKDDWKGEMGRFTVNGNYYYIVHDWEKKDVCEVCLEDLDDED